MAKRLRVKNPLNFNRPMRGGLKGTIAGMIRFRTTNNGYIKLYIKGLMCIAALAFVLIHVLAFEVFAIMGPELGKYLAEAKNQGMMTL